MECVLKIIAFGALVSEHVFACVCSCKRGICEGQNEFLTDRVRTFLPSEDILVGPQLNH